MQALKKKKKEKLIPTVGLFPKYASTLRKGLIGDGVTSCSIYVEAHLEYIKICMKLWANCFYGPLKKKFSAVHHLKGRLVPQF